MLSVLIKKLKYFTIFALYDSNNKLEEISLYWMPGVYNLQFNILKFILQGSRLLMNLE
jgi:hypothetical protein